MFGGHRPVALGNWATVVKGGCDEPGGGNIVEPGDGDVVRNAEARFAAGDHRAHRHQVIGGEDGGWRGGSRSGVRPSPHSRLLR